MESSERTFPAGTIFNHTDDDDESLDINNELMRVAYRAYQRKYYAANKHKIHRRMGETKNQCAYVGPIMGRCFHTTYNKYCCRHPDGKTIEKPSKFKIPPPRVVDICTTIPPIE